MSRSDAHRIFVDRCQDPVADPLRPQQLDNLTDLGEAVLAAFLADVDRDPEAGVACLVDQRDQIPVRVSTGMRAGSRDVDAYHAPRRVADGLLDDHRVLVEA